MARNVDKCKLCPSYSLLLRKWKLKCSVLKILSFGRHKEEGYLPFLCFARPENLARPWETELRPCKCNIVFSSRDIMAWKRTKHNICSVFGCTNENKSIAFVPSSKPLKNQCLMRFSLEMRRHNFPKFCLCQTFQPFPQLGPIQSWPCWPSIELI